MTRSKASIAIVFLIFGTLLSLGVQEGIASGGLQGHVRWLLAGDIQFKRGGDMRLEIHADTDSVTADAPMLEIKTGNAAPVTKFSVDEDGDVVSLGGANFNSDNFVVQASSGNVGVGIAAPDALFHVSDAGTPIMRVATSAAGSQDAVIEIRGARTTSSTSDVAQLEFYNDESGGSFQMAEISARNADGTSGTSNADLLFYTNDGSALTEYMRLDDNGNLGIGTSTPGITGVAKLEIYGTAGSATAGPNLVMTGSADAYPMVSFFNYNHDDMNLMFDAYYNGNFRSSDAGSNFRIRKGSDELTIGYGTGYAAGNVIAWSTGFSVNATTGNVGIGKSGPTEKLDVNGNVKATSFIGNWDPNLTAGSILFDGGSGIGEDNANLYWDNTNDRMAIGTNTTVFPAAGVPATLRVDVSADGYGIVINKGFNSPDEPAALLITSDADGTDDVAIEVRGNATGTAIDNPTSWTAGSASTDSTFVVFANGTTVIAKGSVGDNYSTTNKLEVWGDVYVSGTADLVGLKLNGTTVDATAAEIDQALDGISANVTATNLGTLTGGGNADSLHSHVSAGGGSADDYEVWYETEFPDSVLDRKNGVEVSSGSLQLEAGGTDYIATGTTYSGPIAASNFVWQSFNFEELSGNKISSILIYRSTSGGESIHAEIWRGTAAKIGQSSNSNTQTAGWRTLTFATPIDLSGENPNSEFRIRIYNDDGASTTNVYHTSGNPYADGQSQVSGSYDMSCALVFAAATTGSVYVLPDAPAAEFISSWYEADYGLTLAGETLTVDLVNASTLANLVSSISTDYDISAQSTGVNLGFKVNISRANTGNNPRLNWIARSYIADWVAGGTFTPGGTSKSFSPSEGGFTTTTCNTAQYSWGTEASYTGSGFVKYVSMTYFYNGAQFYASDQVRIIIDGDESNASTFNTSSAFPTGVGYESTGEYYQYYMIPLNMRFTSSLEIQSYNGGTYSTSAYVGWTKDQ